MPIIVTNKISLDKWLSNTIDNTLYDNGYAMLVLSNYLKLWIDSNTELDRFIDDEKFYDEFKNFIFKEYVKPLETYIYYYDEDELYEHYNMTYSDEITDIFIYYKNFTKSLGSQLLHLRDDTSYPLLQFVYNICDYKDPYNDDNELNMKDAPDIDDMEIDEYSNY